MLPPSFGFDLATRRRLTMTLVGTNFFLGGVELSIVIPSLWPFLVDRFGFQHPGLFYGACFAINDVAALICAPLFGLAFDAGVSGRRIALFSFCGAIVANAVYVVAADAWFIFASRLLCGAALACRAALIADVLTTSAAGDKTANAIYVQTARLVGMLAGPAFNFMFTKIDFYLAPSSIRVDQYTAVGLAMMILFLAQLLLSIFFHYDLRELERLEDEARREEDGNKLAAVKNYGEEDKTNETSDETYAESDTLIAEKTLSDPPSTPLSFRRSFGLLLDDAVVVIVAYGFYFGFSYMSVQLALPPVLEERFGVSIFVYSLLAAGIAVFVVVVLFVVHLMSKRFKDRDMLLWSTVASNLLLVALMLFIGYGLYDAAEDDITPGVKGSFVALATVFVAAMSPVDSLAASLLSKVVDERILGLAQSSFANAKTLAYVLTSLWTGALIQTDAYLLFGVQIGFGIFVLVLMAFSWNNLNH